MKIALFGSWRQDPERIDRIFSILKENGVEILVQDLFYQTISSLGNFAHRVDKIIPSCEDFEADMAISIGGDGTFLRTAACIGNKEIPVLGINTGRLGFLADIGDSDMDSTFEDIFSENYTIEKRSRLTLIAGEFSGFNCALNEIAILKQDTASMVTVHSYIDDEYLASYEADGLIISTPTGSTGYSLSVGGPIMEPTAPNFVIAAVAPHSLSDRPLVVKDDCVIKLSVESRSNTFLVSLDGRSATFDAGKELTIKKSPSDLRVVKRIGHTFYGTLRNKLLWGVDPRKRN